MSTRKRKSRIPSPVSSEHEESEHEESEHEESDHEQNGLPDTKKTKSVAFNPLARSDSETPLPLYNFSTGPGKLHGNKRRKTSNYGKTSLDIDPLVLQNADGIPTGEPYYQTKTERARAQREVFCNQLGQCVLIGAGAIAAGAMATKVAGIWGGKRKTKRSHKTQTTRKNKKSNRRSRRNK